MRKTNAVILTILSIIIIFIFFQLPANKTWLNNKIYPNIEDFSIQVDNLAPELRLEAAFGTSYKGSKAIAAFFEGRHILDTVLLLMPPTAYFNARGMNYVVPEPAVFYYFTGLKTVSADSKEAEKANWIAAARQNSFLFTPVVEKQILIDSIQAFRKFFNLPK